MPLYSYRCPNCVDFDVLLAMGDAVGSVSCPACGAPSRRRYTAAHLSSSSSGAYRLIEATERSAAEPAVVRSPGGSPGNARGITTNPLHRKLPRPD